MKTSLLNETKENHISTPLVSVLCMTFNQKDFIRNTLDGFLIQQTTFPIEIIIHDDASTDGTREIIQKYETKHPSLIKGIYQTDNQYSKKVDIPKNFLLPRINGEFIAFCEGDDFWIDPLKLQKQVDFLKHNKDYGLVYTEIDRVDEEGNIIDRSFFKNEPTDFCQTFQDYLINAPFRAPCTWLFRRSLYNIERSKRYAVGDFPMLLDFIAHSKIYKIEDTTANYRVLTKSASHFTSLKQTYSFMKGVFEIQMDYAEKYDVSKSLVKTIKENHALRSYNFAVALHDIDQIKTANKLLKRHPNINYKFKTVQLFSKFRISRELVRLRLNKKLGFSYSLTSKH